jgi:hypothetical protein
MIKNIQLNRPASDAEEAIHNNRRKMIEHQIAMTMERSNLLPPDHPAQRGIERTIEGLNEEANAED